MLSGGLRTKGITKQSQENMPLITVVTVVRNGEKTLEETILSVINQTYTNIEYIIVDGASTDGTLDIVKKYEDRIDYWISEPDKGIYDAMNKGIDLATGDYIALLNSDDWYDLVACELIVNKIIEKKADVYYAMMRIMNERKEVLYIYGYTHNALFHNMISHPACFISKKIYSKYKYDISYHSASDYDFIIRIYKLNACFYFIEKSIVNFRTGGMSSSKKGEIEAIKIRKKHGFISFYEFIIRILLINLKYIYIKLVI